LISRADRRRGGAPLRLLAALALSLCGGCDEVTDEACTPLDSPTFVNVYDLVVMSSCSVGGSCHGGGATAGGLDLGELQVAHESLLASGNVIPGDAGQSPLMSRMDSPVSDVQHMPPGHMLSEAQRCMVAAWITGGAEL
jgi:hypothetical protein